MTVRVLEMVGGRSCRWRNRAMGVGKWGLFPTENTLEDEIVNRRAIHSETGNKGRNDKAGETMGWCLNIGEVVLCIYFATRVIRLSGSCVVGIT